MNDTELIKEQCQHIRLLYVEDEPMTREITQKMLEEIFTHIIVARDGRDGLEKFKENEVDLIIADINMPNMDGFEMMKKIKELDKDMTVLILSAYSAPEYFMQGIELSVDGYLLKPLDIEQFLAILNNVIKSIQLKKEIKRLNERMNLALQGGKTAVLDWDIKDNSFYICSCWKEMLGFSDDELPNRVVTWKERVHGDDKESVFSSLETHFAKQKRYYESTHRLRHKDGHWIWILATAQILYDQKGKPIRMVGTNTDITAEKEAEVALKGEHKYLQSIIDGINDPIMVIKEDYSVDLMNSALQNRITNKRIADLKYPKCYEIFHNRSAPCDGFGHPCLLKNVTTTKKHAVAVHDQCNLKGEKCYVEISATPLFDQEHNCSGVIASVRDITGHLEIRDELEEQKGILCHQAHHDALTGLPNRVLFNDRLEQGIERSKRNKSGLALFFIDLDHFKQINDSLGHAIGDEVLKSVTQRLTSILRKEDTLARLGGDEFTIIMEGLAQSQDASLLAKKILNVFAESIIIGEHTLYVSSSIGISLYPENGENLQDLLKYADAAMYKAKDEGRNNYQFYSAEMTELALERVVMEARLREALEDEDFVVYYQPQVNAESNALTGVEALVRWRHPTMGLVPPVKFIPLAESTGLIIELDRFVMTTAMTQMAKWYSDGLNPGILALNLSLKQLYKNNFIQELENIIQETGYKAEWMEFEVTEGQIMSNPEKAVEILHKISGLGIALSVDDFGTGYSSLSYLNPTSTPKNKPKPTTQAFQGLLNILCQLPKVTPSYSSKYSSSLPSKKMAS